MLLALSHTTSRATGRRRITCTHARFVMKFATVTAMILGDCLCLMTALMFAKSLKKTGLTAMMTISGKTGLTAMMTMGGKNTRITRQAGRR